MRADADDAEAEQRFPVTPHDRPIAPQPRQCEWREDHDGEEPSIERHCEWRHVVRETATDDPVARPEERRERQQRIWRDRIGALQRRHRSIMSRTRAYNWRARFRSPECFACRRPRPMLRRPPPRPSLPPANPPPLRSRSQLRLRRCRRSRPRCRTADGAFGCRRCPNRATRSHLPRSRLLHAQGSARSPSCAPTRSPQHVSPRKSRGSRLRLQSASSRTGKRCPTTSSRRTRTWSPSGSRRCIASRAANVDVALVRRARRRSTASRRQSFLAAHTFFLTQGEKLDVDALKAQLALAGYTHVTQVVSPGEFSVRGGLIDLFPMGSRAALPARPVRRRDRDASRPSTPTRSARSTRCPTCGCCRRASSRWTRPARTRFRSRWREVFEGDPSKLAALQGHSATASRRAGIEYYLPLFFDATATLFDYLPRDAIVALHGDVDAAVERFWQDTESRYRLMRGDKDRPLLPPPQLFLPARRVPRFAESVSAHRAAVPRTRRPRSCPTRRFAACRPCRSTAARDDPLAALKRVARNARRPRAGRRRKRRPARDDAAVLRRVRRARRAVVDSVRRVRRRRRQARARRRRRCTRGFAWPAARLAFVTEAELYASVVRRGKRDSRSAARTSTRWCATCPSCSIGDPVVHEQHGIGRYLGLVTLDLGDGATEFLQLDYANDAKLYVPVSQLHLISRYTGASPEEAPLHKLGSGPVGEGQAQGRRAGARHRGRAAQPVRAARRAQGPRVPRSSRTTTRRSPRASASRRRPTSRRRSTP